MKHGYDCSMIRSSPGKLLLKVHHSAAALELSLRVNHQVETWLKNVLQPTDLGWKLVKGQYVPLTTKDNMFQLLQRTICSTHYKGQYVPLTTKDNMFHSLQRTICSTHYKGQYVPVTTKDNMFHSLQRTICSSYYKGQYVPLTTKDNMFQLLQRTICSTHYKGQYVPLTTQLPAAPNEILAIIHCNCNVVV